jgi:hypothetical protein
MVGHDALAAEICTEARRVLEVGQRSLPQFQVPAPDAAVNGWYNQWTVEMLIEPLSDGLSGHDGVHTPPSFGLPLGS